MARWVRANRSGCAGLYTVVFTEDILASLNVTIHITFMASVKNAHTHRFHDNTCGSIARVDRLNYM